MSLSTALSSILALLATMGWGLTLLRILGLAALPVSLLLGAGYGLGVVLLASLLSLSSKAGLPLSTSGWLLISLGLAAGCWIWIVRKSAVAVDSVAVDTKIDHTSGFTPLDWSKKSFAFALLTLIAVHLYVVVINNTTRPIFPWDAFTTWMYRAKAWAMQDTITSMAFVPQWISNGGSGGYAIYASDYPTAISVYAAFMSSLTGLGWHPGAASIPWGAALLALCALIYGSLSLAGMGKRPALIGSYLIGSLPIINIHSALAGYGDLWIALVSGGGLALLLVWRTTFAKHALVLAFVMLTAGTQIKTEGWLWLGLGIVFVTLEWLAGKLNYIRLTVVFSLIISVLVMSGLKHFALGPLGEWGITETHMHIGALGSYALRPYNPFGNYWRITFEYSNFLSLGALYLFALISLLVLKKREAVPFWSMGFLIALSQVIIFGLSAYSQYAETGTAITRILVHFTPVFVVTAVLAWDAYVCNSTEQSRPSCEASDRPPSAPRLDGSLVFTSLLILFSIMAPAFLLFGHSSNPVRATELDFTQEDFVTVAGRTAASASGLQFIASPIRVGVLKAPIDMSITDPPRYLITDLSIENSGDASFYWMVEGSADVHSIAISMSGRNIEHLGEYQVWRDRKIRELGFLVKDNAFSTSRIRGISLKDTIDIADAAALFNHWLSPEPINHTLINNTIGHMQAPVSLNQWALGSTLVVLIIAAGTFLFAIPNPANSIGAALLLLWVINDLLWLNSSGGLKQSIKMEVQPETRAVIQAETKTNVIAETVGMVGNRSDSVLLVTIDEGSLLTTQKLPFKLLPRAAAHTTPNEAQRAAASWQGEIVVIGSEMDQVLAVSKKIIGDETNMVVRQHEGFTLLSKDTQAQ